ncbi:MAG TPA: VanZ family protein [Thermodesulfobacteriota bacterium]|nr:VanZ family protein [Thermodesulfobacteriota bacterium]
MILNRRFIKYWFPVILWMCFIFWMSTETFSSESTFSWTEILMRFLLPKISSQEVLFINAFIRKAAHVTEYFVLGLLMFRAFRGRSVSSWKWRWSFFALIVVVLWATGDELHQSFVPNRTASAVDVAIDTAGGILAQCLAFLWHRGWKK